ncbi:MAG: hypothetical protein JXB32_03035 [Deltaproteobacteria bacterium]|nr:hypothetical protein [Deltaproteobacteria bacterium]
MANDRFNPAGYFTFDLAHGRAATEKTGVLVLPVEFLERLAGETDAAPLERLARGFGEWLGKRVRDRLAAGGGDPLSAAPETFLNELNGLLAVHGLGRAVLESFGEVLLVRLDGDLLAGVNGAAFFEALFSGVFTTFLGQDASCLAMETPGGRCLLVANPAAIRRATQLRSAGVGPETIATRLYQEARAAREGER